MPNLLSRIIFSTLVICVYHTSCYEHLCDVERWLTDNEMPVNRLEVSTYAKGRLLQSLKSPDRLIKCSFLRSVHKEADLDRSFKQSRYRVSRREIQSRQKSQDKDREDDSNDDDKLLDAVDAIAEKSRSSRESDDNASSEKNRPATADQSLPHHQEQDQTVLDKKQPENKQKPEENLQNQTESQQQPEQQQQKQPESQQQLEQQQEKQPESQHQPEQQQQIQPELHVQNEELLRRNASNVSNNNNSISMGSQNVENLTNHLTAEEGSKFINQTHVSSREAVSDIDLKNTSLHLETNKTMYSKREGSSWFRLCTTKCMQEDRSKSVWICRIFQKIELSSSESKSNEFPKQSKTQVQLETVCRSCTAQNLNQSSLHICEVFFPTIHSQSLTQLENNSNTGTLNSVENQSVESAARAPNNDFASLCFQCGKSPNNRTQSICIFAIKLDSSSRKPHPIAAKLHFIDDNDSIVRAQQMAGSTAPIIGGGGELEEAELPTRLRQDAKVKQNQSKQVESPQEAKTVQNETSPIETDRVDNTDEGIVANQVESLAHSIFMEKLFDSLFSKRAATVESMLNLSRRLDNMKNQLDRISKTTVRNASNSDNEATIPKLEEFEDRFALIFARMVHQNRRLVQRIQALEAATLSGHKANQRRWNVSLSRLKKESDSRISRLERRIRQMTDQLNRLQNSCKCQQPASMAAHPAMPSMMKDGGGTQQQAHPHDQRQQYFMANTADAILPNINGKSLIQDCSEIYAKEKSRSDLSDGVFIANLGVARPVKVRCDMRNQGWTYVLSRSDGSTNFFRNWTSYQTGFGDPSGEHFLGLDALSEMTSRRQYRLWIVLEDWEGQVKHVNYESFIVLGKQHNYQLRVDRFHGDESVGDSLSSHSNASFSTFDSDNDLVDKKFGGSCARRFRGGFWYFSCYRANPTGQYYQGGRIPDKRCDGIVWKTWKGPHYSLKSIHMKIKPL